MDFTETMQALFGFDPTKGQLIGQNGTPGIAPMQAAMQQQASEAAPAAQPASAMQPGGVSPMTPEQADPTTPTRGGRVLATLPRNGAPPQGVLDRLNPQRDALDTLGSGLMAGAANYKPEFGGGGNFLMGLAGALNHGGVEKAQDAKNALETYKTLFDIQDRSEGRAEALRQHQLQTKHLDAQLAETQRYHDMLGDYYGAKGDASSTGSIGIIRPGGEFSAPVYGFKSGPNAGKTVEEVYGQGGAGAGASGGASAPVVQPQKTQFNPDGTPAPQQRPKTTDWENVLSSGLTGQDFLGQLSEGDAGMVKAIAEGRQPVITGFALKEPHNRALMKAVTLYDPNADATTIKARGKMRQEYASNMPNSSGGMIRSGTTAMSHLERLSDAAEKLGTIDSAILNKAKNAIELQTGGNIPALLQKTLGIKPEQATALSKFLTDQEVYAKEAEKFYRGTGGTDTGIKGMFERIDPSLPPALLKTAIRENAALLHGQFKSLEGRWVDTLGPNAEMFPVVKPGVKRIFNKIYGRAGDEESPYATPSAPANVGVAPSPSAAPPSPTTPRGGATPSGGRVDVTAPAPESASPASGGFPAPNEGQIGHLKANPSLRDHFDHKFGPGAADKILGPSRRKRGSDVVAEAE